MRYDIQIAKIKDENSNLLGYAEVTLGGSFTIRGIKIMNGSNGPFVSMPNYKSSKTDEDGRAVYKDICHAANGDFRNELVSNILSAYLGKHSPEISKVTCTCLEDKGNLKAIADVVFNDSFVVKGVKIMEGSDGTFVSMPNYKISRDGNDEFRDVCNPVTKDFYEQFTNTVLESYEAAKSGENTKTFAVSQNLPRYNVSIHKMKDNDSNVLAYAELSIGGSFVIKGIKIMDGPNGAFVSMPNYKSNKVDENGGAIYQDVCFPITKEAREKIFSNILSAYDGSKKPQITDVKCTCLEDKDNLKAIASVTFDKSFTVEGVKVMEGSNGSFISMPNYKVSKDGNDEFRDICFPVTSEFRNEFNNAVMNKYDEVRDKSINVDPEFQRASGKSR